MSNRDAILRRMAALKAKTVENGATEAEAMAAAEKLAAMAAEYGIGLGEAEIKDDRYGAKQEAYGATRLHEVARELCATVASLFDTHVILVGPKLEYFGSEVDVAASHYLVDLLVNCADAAWAEQQRKVRRGDADGNTGRAARTAFMTGFIERVQIRICQLREARKAKPNALSRNALVVMKTEIVKKRYDVWVAAQGLKLTKMRSRETAVDRSTADYDAGQAAGDDVNITTGVDAAPRKRITK